MGDQFETSAMAHAFTKIVFTLLIIAHVIVWPSAWSIFATAAYAALVGGQLMRISMARDQENKAYFAALAKPGILLFQSDGRRYGIVAAVYTLYFGLFFAAFITHETMLLPATTNWIHWSYVGNYSFSEKGKAVIPGSVTDASAKEMRNNVFTWERSYDFTPPAVTGSIDGFTCGQSESPFYCVAPKMLLSTPPADAAAYEKRPFVPLSSDFYDIDVRVMPGDAASGANCADLEVYRVNIGADGTIAHKLDYPGSKVVPGVPATQTACNIFGMGTTTCLPITHAFTPAQYKEQITEKCSKEGGGLVFRLPIRTADVDDVTGATALDVLFVTKGATVTTHATWNRPDEEWYTSFWKQIHVTDSLQGWRESYSSFDIVMRFFIATAPVLIGWYYLLYRFEEMVCAGSIVILWVMVMLPSALLFVSVGAWIPAVGCVACVIAIHNRVDLGKPSGWAPLTARIRHVLLFIMAACNSIQAVWLLVLIGQAGYSAFYYEYSLQQLYDMSYSLIISSGAPPTYIGVLMPSVLVLTLVTLIGSVTCLAMEIMASGNAYAVRRGFR